ncbi:hypothetical protein [Parvicella tangerina]|uniref:GIY-YIG domain-containing protein n=1 Tax=Parvicella tangerina TaxID=2829795 RepID=A0A916NU87_9FLAO|nr:hypothetical protein [Parvicella tangerina]CAG5087700.1 hypothetical protein CRYO30217_03553 [Parvicella tangerina]
MDYKKDTYKEIVVNWEKGSAIETYEDFQNYCKLHPKPNNFKQYGCVDEGLKTSDQIFYQIYGDHHVYGRNTLLYIGISKDVLSRFRHHLNGVFKYVNNKSISIGRADTFLNNMEEVESILIANHKPAFNKTFIHDLHEDSRNMDRDDTNKIIIINNGNNGMLKTCCTNYWWVN